jgi:tRNA (cytidine/uridine-2'-O-)-methyltransferase
MKFTVTSPDEILRGHQPPNAPEPLFHVALIEPEIPQNTGNIGRTCVGTRSDLHLVGELGFKITDRNLKRAGLDYWQHLSWRHHPSLDGWRREIRDPKRVFYLSAKATRTFYDVEYRKGDWLVFGRETKGLPDDILQQNSEQTLLIPILGPVRGYNVATSVAVVLFEALRQLRTRGEMPEDFILDPAVLAQETGEV